MFYCAYKSKELADFRAAQGLGGPASLPDHLRPGKGALTKIVAELWKNETAEVREHFHQLAEQEKVDHKQRDPTYRYRPQRKATNSGGSGSRGSSRSGSRGSSRSGGSSSKSKSKQYSLIRSNDLSSQSSSAEAVGAEHGLLPGPVLCTPTPVSGRSSLNAGKTQADASGPELYGTAAGPSAALNQPGHLT